MRFMMLMIPKGYESAAPGAVPDDVAAVEAMMKYNEALQKAGVLLSLDGLHPVSDGARVAFDHGMGSAPRIEPDLGPAGSPGPTTMNPTR